MKPLADIERDLPNGFHDALLEDIEISFLTAEVRMTLQLFLGEPDAVTKLDREKYRRATLLFKDVVYFVIDAPSEGRIFAQFGPLRIDAGEASRGPNAPKSLRPLPPGAFAYWVYIEVWNSFIHLAARFATLEWK
jgi:hypothetical protein